MAWFVEFETYNLVGPLTEAMSAFQDDVIRFHGVAMCGKDENENLRIVFSDVPDMDTLDEVQGIWTFYFDTNEIIEESVFNGETEMAYHYDGFAQFYLPPYINLG